MKKIVILLMAYLMLLAGCIQNSTSSAHPKERVFQSLVSRIKDVSLERQYDYLKRLSKGIQTSDLARFSGEWELPTFKDLAKELYCQSMINVLRKMIKECEISPFHYNEIVRILAENQDSVTLDILIVNSSADEMIYKSILDKAKKNRCFSDENIPEISAHLLSNYINNDLYSDKAHKHLASILLKHKSANVRGFAAIALGNSKNKETIEILKQALNDNGDMNLMQGSGNETVAKEAQEAIDKIQGKPRK